MYDFVPVLFVHVSQLIILLRYVSNNCACYLLYPWQPYAGHSIFFSGQSTFLDVLVADFIFFIIMY